MVKRTKSKIIQDIEKFSFYSRLRSLELKILSNQQVTNLFFIFKFKLSLLNFNSNRQAINFEHPLLKIKKFRILKNKIIKLHFLTHYFQNLAQKFLLVLMVKQLQQIYIPIFLVLSLVDRLLILNTLYSKKIIPYFKKQDNKV